MGRSSKKESCTKGISTKFRDKPILVEMQFLSELVLYNDELKGVRIELVALVDNFNPNASEAGM